MHPKMEWQTITKMSEWSKRDALNLQLPETRINGSLDVAERDVLHSEQMFWQITYALHANKIETLTAITNTVISQMSAIC